MRFRDNLILHLLNDFSCTEVILFLKGVYQMQFTIQQFGKSLLSLELHVEDKVDSKGRYQSQKVIWKGVFP